MQRMIFYAGLVCLFLLAIPAHRALEGARGSSVTPKDPKRIVSLAPSVTETLYALGLGPRVVGVTEFCAYPPEAANLPRVAGFGFLHAEALVRLRPDLAALPTDKTAQKNQIEQLGIPTLSLDTRSLPGFLESVKSLGAATGHEAQADALRTAFRQALLAAQQRAAGKIRPRVLFAVMHSSMGTNAVTEINAIGRDGFFNELIEAAGGVNAYQGGLAFPRLSRESIMFLNPDVIIASVHGGEDPEAIQRGWESLGKVTAVREGRLHLLTDAADTVPGPRSVRTLVRLSQALHPDASDTHDEDGCEGNAR